MCIRTAFVCKRCHRRHNRLNLCSKYETCNTYLQMKDTNDGCCKCGLMHEVENCPWHPQELGLEETFAAQQRPDLDNYDWSQKVFDSESGSSCVNNYDFMYGKEDKKGESSKQVDPDAQEGSVRHFSSDDQTGRLVANTKDESEWSSTTFNSKDEQAAAEIDPADHQSSHKGKHVRRGSVSSEGSEPRGRTLWRKHHGVAVGLTHEDMEVGYLGDSEDIISRALFHTKDAPKESKDKHSVKDSLNVFPFRGKALLSSLKDTTQPNLRSGLAALDPEDTETEPRMFNFEEEIIADYAEQVEREALIKKEKEAQLRRKSKH